MRRAGLLIVLAFAVSAVAVGCGNKKPPVKSDKPVEWEDYQSSSIGVSFKKPKDFTETPDARGTFTDGVGYITATFDKGTKSLDQIISEEITRKKRDTETNFKSRKIKDWAKAFNVLKNEKKKFGNYEGVELELSLAKEPKENAPRIHRIETWIKTSDGLITVVWMVDEPKWEKYYEKFFRISRESFKVTK